MSENGFPECSIQKLHEVELHCLNDALLESHHD